MLCLRQQIRCHIPGIGRFICQNKNLAGTGNAVNTHMTIHSLLCQSYKNIARPYDFIDAGNGFRTKSKSCHCLCPSGLVYLGSSRQAGGNQCNRIDLSVFIRRRYHDNSRNSCNLCRNNIHQNRRRISCLSAWNIDAHTGKRRYLLS